MNPQSDEMDASEKTPDHAALATSAAPLARRHAVFGWWSLLGFLSLGIALEALHGFKIGWYMDVANSTRRHMWTLAHAHGTLLSLVHIAYALTLRTWPDANARRRGAASTCLTAASLLIPLGFFLGGIVIYAGDPGLGILLVPLGALGLLAGVGLTARGVSESSAAEA